MPSRRKRGSKPTTPRSKKVQSHPKKFRRFSLLDLCVMPFFWMCDEITDRIRYQMIRWSKGKIRP